MVIMMIGGKGKKGMFPAGAKEGSAEEEATESPDEEATEDKPDGDAAKDEASKALMRAVKMGDTSGVREALQAFHDACYGE